MMRVHVEQYGCATTEGEAQTMRGVLAGAGHALVATPEEADAVVLVTCTVVDATERRMTRRMRALAAEGKRLVVTGCMASAQPAAVRAAAPGAVVLPAKEHRRVAAALAPRAPVSFPAARAAAPRVLDGALASVVVNEGCSGKCTFCITKLARPGLESVPVEDVVREVAGAVAAGAAEVRLTSQDAGAYGLDAGSSLPDLVRAVTSRVPGDYGIRVGMLNPWTLASRVDDYVDAFRDPRVFKFLHVPVQSGSPRVLRAMARNHGVDDVVAAVDAFRRAYPDLALATDVICGYPGETEEDFAMTLDLLARLAPEVVNVTRYSPRPGTAASALAPVPGREAKARSRRATALRWALAREALARWVGREVEALVTEPGTRPGTVRARTMEYRQVVVPGEEGWMGRRVRVRVERAGAADLAGRVVG